MTDPDAAEQRRDEQEQRRDAQEQRQLGAHDKGHRDAVYLACLVVVLFGISIFWSSHTAKDAAAGRAQIEQQAIEAQSKLITAQEKAITAACDFWYPLTPLPVTIVTGQTRPTELSVRLISGARESYQGQCTNDDKPPLPSPDPSFAHWAAFYHLPVTP